MSRETASQSAPIRVVHLITDLDIGGAEIVLARLLRALDPSRVQNTVVSLTSGGALAEAIAATGTRVIELNMRQGRLNVVGLYRAYQTLRSMKPDVVQTWLYHADLAGLVAGTLAGVPRIVWNLRCSELNVRDFSRFFRLMLRLLALSSRFPSAVICNSTAGRRVHEQLGYRPRRWEVIANGVDPDAFRPSAGARARFRQELAISEQIPLVGLVARHHPMKDHETFLRAAAIISRQQLAHFVLVGRGVSESDMLRELVASLDLTGRVHLLPERTDVAEILPALDIAVSSSISEGFPNVLIEAMACGTPCVTTDAGDSGLIVADSARVVPVRNPAALAGAILRLLDMSSKQRRTLGLEDRSRVVANYSSDVLATRYQTLYEDLVRSQSQTTEPKPSCAA
jgi:glycosyltransferase involved in cell wall biosynthesis